MKINFCFSFPGIFFGVGWNGGGGRIVVVRNLSPTTLGNNNLHGRTSPYRFFFSIYTVTRILNSLYNLTRHPLRRVWQKPKGAALDTATSWPQGDKSG